MARLKSVTMDDDVIYNDIVQGPGYLEVKDTDFALKLSGVSITKEN